MIFSLTPELRAGENAEGELFYVKCSNVKYIQICSGNTTTVRKYHFPSWLTGGHFVASCMAHHAVQERRDCVTSQTTHARTWSF